MWLNSKILTKISVGTVAGFSSSKEVLKKFVVPLKKIGGGTVAGLSSSKELLKKNWWWGTVILSGIGYSAHYYLFERDDSYDFKKPKSKYILDIKIAKST